MSDSFMVWMTVDSGSAQNYGYSGRKPARIVYNKGNLLFITVEHPLYLDAEQGKP